MNTISNIDKVIQFVGKLFLYIIGCLFTAAICLFVFLFLTEWFWPEFNGSYSLGNNIYMLEWDGGGRIIVQGINIVGNTCYGGEPLIPFYENRYDSIGNYTEYVVDAKSDNNWIIVKTEEKSKRQRKYYIIDKSFDPKITNISTIKNKYMTEFYDSIRFYETCQSKGIDTKSYKF